jgi:hypothetical protein
MSKFSPEQRSGGKLRLFVIGALMAFSGGYMLMNSVTVAGGSWYIGGYNGFGVTLVPLLLGVGILFFSERSVWGWILTLGSTLAIALGIIMNLNVYLQPTTLWNTIIMLVLLVGGLGLLARSLR